MTSRAWCLVAFVLIVGAVPAVPLAQDARAPARLIHVEGAVYLDGQPVDRAALPITLPATAEVHTTMGWALLTLKAGTTLGLVDATAIRIHENGPDNSNRVDVTDGVVFVVTGAGSPEVHCPGATPLESDTRTSRVLVRLSSEGRFRFERRAQAGTQPLCAMRVYAGAAAVPASRSLRAFRQGQEVLLPTDYVIVERRDFDPTQTDPLERWMTGLSTNR